MIEVAVGVDQQHLVNLLLEKLFRPRSILWTYTIRYWKDGGELLGCVLKTGLRSVGSPLASRAQHASTQVLGGSYNAHVAPTNDDDIAKTGSHICLCRQIVCLQEKGK